MLHLTLKCDLVLNSELYAHPGSRTVLRVTCYHAVLSNPDLRFANSGNYWHLIKKSCNQWDAGSLKDIPICLPKASEGNSLRFFIVQGLALSLGGLESWFINIPGAGGVSCYLSPKRMMHASLSIYNEQSNRRGNQTLHLQACHVGSHTIIRLLLGEYEVRRRLVSYVI